MNINVNRKTGEAKVALEKRERNVLAEAAGVLWRLGRHADHEPATTAGDAVIGVLRHFVPAQKELPLEKVPTEEKSPEPPSEAVAGQLSSGVPDVPGAELSGTGDAAPRSRKGRGAPHGIV